MEPKLDLSSVGVIMEGYEALRVNYKFNYQGQPLSQKYGAELIASAIVLTSSLLQSFVQECFEIRFKEKFMHVKSKEDMDKIWKSIGRWGNPSPENIDALFLRIGIFGLTKDYTYLRDPQTDRLRLSHFNAIRNKIAHGHIQRTYEFDKHSYKLGKSDMHEWISEIDSFGYGFLTHIKARQV